MRILFFCGCLEPGRDGVGDYTRALAAACARLGHSCGIVALNDPYVDRATDFREGQVVLLRLPEAMTWEERVRRAGDFRNLFQPDWLSLQLVSYGLQKKGILWPVNRHLRKLLEGGRLHVMFHEVWIGLFPGASLKYRVVGALQKLSFWRLGKMLKPAVATTSNPLYRAVLRQIGIPTTILPLLNNIAITPVTGQEMFWETFRAAGVTADGRGEWWLGVFFGELYPEWKPEPFFSVARRAAKKVGRKLAFISLGRSGKFGPGIWQQLQRNYSDLTFVTLGEQPFEHVSAVMQLCDFGVPTSALQLIGKSGSAAAMLEHGLPVIVTRLDPQCRFPLTESSSDDPMIFLCDETLEARMAAGLPRHEPCSRTERIAEQFCDLLRPS